MCASYACEHSGTLTPACPPKSAVCWLQHFDDKHRNMPTCLPHLGLPCLVSACPALPCPVRGCPALLRLGWPALPCLGLPCHALCLQTALMSHTAIDIDSGIMPESAGEKPFAGMRHAQIIYHATTLLAHPQIPKDAPPQLKVLVWSGPQPLPILCVLCKSSDTVSCALVQQEHRMNSMICQKANVCLCVSVYVSVLCLSICFSCFWYSGSCGS